MEVEINDGGGLSLQRGGILHEIIVNPCNLHPVT